MGLCCTVDEDPKELINNLKLKLKSTKTKAETKIDEKNKEIEKYKELAKINIKNGNRKDARDQIEEKQKDQKIIEILQVKIGIIDDLILELENTEVNQDITGIIDSITKKNKKIDLIIGNKELEVEAVKMLKEKNYKRKINEELSGEINQSDEEDLNVLEELKQLEAEVND